VRPSNSRALLDEVNRRVVALYEHGGPHRQGSWLPPAPATGTNGPRLGRQPWGFNQRR